MTSLAERPGTDILRLQPYLGEIAEACLAEGEDAALLAAIMLRETGAGWAPGYEPKGSHLGRGDHGHGWFLYQFDDRGPYKHLPKECPDATVFLQTRWACQVLKDARRELAKHAAHPEFEKAAICAYNAGSPRVAKALLLGQSPDAVTAKGPSGHPDYGSDVIRRRDELRRKYPERFPLPAPRAA